MDLEKTSIVKTTYSVADILEWQRAGTLDLRPFYQRRSVWNGLMKSLLIDSLLRSYPIPLIFLHNSLNVSTSKTVRNVVDGQQRLRTILSFVDPNCLQDPAETDRFTISELHNAAHGGDRFADLSEIERQQILETQLSVNLLPADVQDVTILKMFQRLNSTGVKLSAQESRNAQFAGPFKTLSYDLAYEQHRRWGPWGLFRPDQIAQMLEVEFTSDLLGYLLRGVESSSKPALDALYGQFDDENSQIPNSDAITQIFRSTFDKLDRHFGLNVPKTHLKAFRTRNWIYAIFAVVADQSSNAGSQEADLDVALLDALARLDTARADNPDFARSLRGATTHKASRQARIDFLLPSFTS